MTATPIPRFEMRRMPIADLTPAPYNPRRIDDPALAGLTSSVKRFGLVQPIVWNRRTQFVVGGHQRLRAMEKLGETDADVIVVDLDEAEERALNIALNNGSIAGEFIEEQLQAILDDLRIQVPDIYEELRLAELDTGTLIGQREADPDAVPEPPDAATTQPGDLWILGDHRLLCGDSTSAVDVDRLLDGAPIHLVNTDPPYNVKVEPRSNNAIAAGLSSFSAPESKHHQRFDVERHPEKAKGTTRKMRAKDRPLANDFVSDDEFDRLLDAWFGNMARVLLPGRGFYIWGGYANLGNYPPFLRKHELYFSQGIIWDKEHPVLTRMTFPPETSPVFKWYSAADALAQGGSVNEQEDAALGRADRQQAS